MERSYLKQEENHSDQKEKQPKNILLEITKLQSSNGSWKLKDVASILQTNIQNITWQYNIESLVKDDVDDILATALFISYIQTKFPNDEQIWKMLVHKARLWIIKLISQSMQKDDAVKCTQLLINSGNQYFSSA